VIGINALMENKQNIEAHSLMDMFKERYELRTLIRDGKLSEYSAHVIPEGGMGGISKLIGNGIIITGDAAGFALNMGVTVRGMEFAIASGIIAAETITKAKEADDFSEKTLSYYETRLKETFVLKDLQTCKDMPDYLDSDSFFALYPKCFPDLAEKVMWFDNGPKAGIGKTAWNNLKSSGMLSLKRLMEFYRLKNI
jgi:electron transfer flavoprotein-quinone oxidoreductase